ncbi:MAG: hypothetical protein M1828_000409 [Chrysothrix sp. TS-e1954]|nr:MAG: hypothetical protein M1828_000409 [Chrysothrix sp. TS-e1954]
MPGIISLPSAAVLAVIGTVALNNSPADTPLRSTSFTGTFLKLFGILFWALIAWRVILFPKVFSPLKSLPHPKGGGAVMGHFRQLNNTNPGILHTEWTNEIPNKGLIRYLAQFNEERIMPVTAAALNEILNLKNYSFIKSPARGEFAGRILGNGVLIAQGNTHKVQRKNLQPAFGFGHIKELYPLFWTKACELAEALRVKLAEDEKNSWKTINIAMWESRAALDIIGVAAMGQEFHAIQDPNSELSAAWSLLTEPTPRARNAYVLGRILPFSVVTRLPIRRNKEIEEGVNSIRSACHRTIQSRREKPVESKDILAVAMKSGQFNDDQLVDQLMNFLGAGHDTTSTATTWAVFYMCKFPEWQEKLRTEVREKLPNPLESGTSVTAPEINACPHLLAFCNEVLRYRPPVDTAVRDVHENVEVQGHKLSPETRLTISISGVNRSKELWGEKALEFDPNRWLEGDETAGTLKTNNSGGSSSNYAMMTFLHGPRSCIGQNFARGEMQILVASLVSAFEFRVQDKSYEPPVTTAGITSKPSGGLEVEVRVAAA